MIPFQCPYCGLETAVEDRYAEKSGPCGCGRTVTVPASDAVDAPTDAVRNRASQPRWLKTALTISVVLTCLLAIGCVSFWLLQPVIKAAQTQARKTRCAAQIRQIMDALYAYHAEHGKLPAAYTTDETGQPLHSWRVAILPYLGPDARAIYQQLELSEPWNSPNNVRFNGLVPIVYQCPADRPFAIGDTSYCAVVGKGFALDTTRQNSLSEIVDPLESTVVIVEVANSQINWMAPRDVSASQLAQGVGSGSMVTCRSRHESGAVFAGFADGLAREINDYTAQTLMDMATISGRETVRVEAKRP